MITQGEFFIFKNELTELFTIGAMGKFIRHSKRGEVAFSLSSIKNPLEWNWMMILLEDGNIYEISGVDIKNYTFETF